MTQDSNPPRLPTASDLDGLVGWTLIRTARRWAGVIATALEPCELTPVQFGMLAQLSAHPHLTQSELAARILMRPQSMSHLLDTMEGRGLVRRAGARGSGRRNPVALTEAGTDLLATAWPLVESANAPAATGLDAATSRRLNDTLMTLLHRG